MRKDVHIGLAIGGVLLAVLIVWGVVVSGSKKQNKVTLVTTPDAVAPSSPANDIPPPLTPAPTTEVPSTPPVAPAPMPAPAPDAPAVPAKKDWSALMSGKTTLDAEPLKTETPAPSDPTKSSADSAGQSGAAPMPTALAASAVAAGGDSASTPTPSSPSPSAAASDPGAAPAEPTPPADPAPAAGGTKPAAQRTHTVQRNETFSSIAKAVYGDARYYQQIEQANPKINPNKLRPGTVIALPDVSTVKSAVKSAAPAASKPEASAKPPDSSAAAVDLQKEYRVAANDSLYKISMRLYGSGEEVDHLYEMNKSIIGSDPAKLKVGTILKIPAPPTVATASASSAS